MTDTATNPSAGWRMKVAIAAVAVSICAVLWFVTAALGTKFGLWGWQVGLGQMTIGFGPLIAISSVALGVIAQVIALIKSPRKQPFIVALAATLIAGMLLFRLIGMGAQASALPPIHDVQTDWSDPIHFSELIMSDRTASDETNPVEDAPTISADAAGNWPGMEGRLVSEVQQEAEAKEGAYPVIEPFYFDGSPGELAALTQTLMEKKGWEVVSPAPEIATDSIQVEATVTSWWFGFKDDVAVRIRSEGGVTRVDMRSTSRVGLSDLGANSKRVYGLMMELQDRADGRSAP